MPNQGLTQGNEGLDQNFYKNMASAGSDEENNPK